MRGMRAPSTESIAPVDVALSRFMTRHGPLEVANRLLSQFDKPTTTTTTQQQQQQRRRVGGGGVGAGKTKTTLIESVVWQSATGSEYELAKIPKAAAQAIRQSLTCPTTSELLWPVQDADGEYDESVDAAANTTSSPDNSNTTTSAGSTGASAFEDAKVVVVPFHGGNPGGLNSGVNASQAFYQHLMDAVQLGLQKVESIQQYEMTSTKRKRRLKMNKHKFKKRRKEQESLRKKLG